MFHECDECTGAEYQISRRQRKVFLDNNEFKRDKKRERKGGHARKQGLRYEHGKLKPKYEMQERGRAPSVPPYSCAPASKKILGAACSLFLLVISKSYKH